MGLKKDFSSLILSNSEISSVKINLCFDFLIKNNFLGYDYESTKYINFSEILHKYPEDPRYNLRYKMEDFGITNPIGKKYLISRIDGESSDSEIIIKGTNEFCKIIQDISFSYIDNEGDSPSKFEDIISKKEIKWLFKYNYFGKDFIEKFGKDFFVNMPCVNQEFISDHIIRIDLCKDLFSPVDKALMKEVSEYLNSFSIKVNFYNHKNYLID